MRKAKDKDWETSDSLIAQELANQLNTEVAGFLPQPTTDARAGDASDIPHLPNVETELFRRNGLIIQSVILSGLIHGDSQQQETIVSSVQAESFWPKSFRKYLFVIITHEIREKGRVSIEAIQAIIPQHTEVEYGYASTRRTLLGDYYNWAQILRLRPTWNQVVRAMELIKEVAQT